MKKTYIKTFFREIKHSFGRFIAIIAIVALGVGFLMGLLSATPDMKASVDEYYDKYDVADVFVKGTAGFSDDDVAAVKNSEGIKSVTPYYVLDVPGKTLNQSVAVRMYSFDFEAAKDLNWVNKIELLEGKYPSSDDECVVERSGDHIMNIPLNSEIEVSDKKYKVVGKVGNPWHFSNEKEITGIGTGKITAIVYTSGFTLPKYTDLFITVSDAKNLSPFSGAYDNKIKAASIVLNALGEARSEILHGELTEGLPPAEAEKVPLPKWFVLDRDSNVSFVSFEMNGDKISAVATIFPIFFFLVAALVALTTMTRMVEEERLQIGTLKSLGYKNATIRTKYVLYCGIASILGCAVGVLCGFALLPTVIWSSFEFLFHLPQLVLVFDVWVAVLSSLAATFSTMFATIWACNKTLKEKPSQLLLPKAPKDGKRTVLEKLPFWKKLKFKYKSSARNILRYKKHFFMTVIGIGGCTALVLTGFGMSDAVGNITPKQYGEIFKYDLSVRMAEGSEDNIADVTSDAAIKDFTLVYSESGFIRTGDRKEAITLIVPEKTEEFAEFVRLNKRGKKPFKLNADSVVVTENMATELKLKVGDKFTFDGTERKKEYTLTNITENYIDNYIYVGAIENVKPNVIYAKSSAQSGDYDSITERILTYDGVSGAEFTHQSKQGFDKLLGSIGVVIIVIIVSAGGLAVIVLYNLTNININERKKELATLKVLGYRNSEVAGYIYREIAVLTVIGLLVGLGLGILLHYFVVVQTESLVLMFSRAISPLSFLYAALITIGFSAIVDLLMLIKLKKISMVESMKAPE